MFDPGVCVCAVLHRLQSAITCPKCPTCPTCLCVTCPTRPTCPTCPMCPTRPTRPRALRALRALPVLRGTLSRMGCPTAPRKRPRVRQTISKETQNQRKNLPGVPPGGPMDTKLPPNTPKALPRVHFVSKDLLGDHFANTYAISTPNHLRSFISKSPAQFQLRMTQRKRSPLRIVTHTSNAIWRPNVLPPQ